MNIKRLESLLMDKWPDDAADVLIPVLSDRSASQEDRAMAAVLAAQGTAVCDPMASALLRVLADPAEDLLVRSEASKSLGLILGRVADSDACLDCEFMDDCSESGDLGYCNDDPEDLSSISDGMADQIQSALRLLYSDPDTNKVVRCSALYASIQKPEQWHEDALRMAYACGDPEWRMIALRCMPYCGEFEDEVLDSMSSDNPDIRRVAVDVAGLMELELAWPAIRKILESRTEDRELMLSAIGAALPTGGYEAEEMLEVLTGHSDPEIAEEAEEALMYAEEMDDFEDFTDEDD